MSVSSTIASNHEALGNKFASEARSIGKHAVQISCEEEMSKSFYEDIQFLSRICDTYVVNVPKDRKANLVAYLQDLQSGLPDTSRESFYRAICEVHGSLFPIQGESLLQALQDAKD